MFAFNVHLLELLYIVAALASIAGGDDLLATLGDNE